MRYLLVLMLSISVLLSSCSGKEAVDRLAYQRERLYVEALFTLDGESVDASLTLEAPSYDENGRMLARDAVIAFGEDSIIAGVGFEIVGGEVFITAGDLRIPLESRSSLSGIYEMISLFCISEGSYYSSEKLERDGLKCERAVYINGDNRVEVTIDLGSGLPTDIEAFIDGRELSADIKLIKAE